MFFTSDTMSMINTGLGFLNSYNQAKTAKIQGETNKILGGIQADALLRNATEAMNAGVTLAREEKRKGEQGVSDATAAMAAGGSVVDPVLLARLKTRADHNAMSAIYNAKSDARDLKLRSDMARIGADYQGSVGNTKAADIMLGATSTALTNWPKKSGKPATTSWKPTRAPNTSGYWSQ